MPFLTEDPRDLSNSGLLTEDIFFNTVSATKFKSNNTSYVTSQPSSAGSNLPTGNAKQYETAFTDATGNPNYTPGTPVFVQGAHTLKNGGVHFQNINVFEDLQSHWEGSSRYARYRYAANQRGGRKIKSSLIPTNLPENTPNNIELMKNGEGALSFLTGRPDRIVMDLVFYLDGNFRCPLPSPITGKITSLGYGTESATKIKGDEGSVRMLHMDNFLVQKGDKVVEGQIIGTQSDIMSKKPANVHLHFEAPENIMRRYIKKMLDGSYVPGAKTPKTKEEKAQELVDNAVQGVKDFFGSFRS